MEEIWKDVAGYEGLYQVSNMGRVKSLARTRNMNLPWGGIAPVNERIRKFGKSLGYQNITLSKNGVNERIRVHKLVAMTFIPNPRGCTQINHKNGDKHDNRVENLEWVTPSENQRHAIETGLRKDAFRRKKVNHYDRDGNFIRSWNGYVEIRDALGIPCQSVCNCCKGRCPSANGYIWRLADE